MDYSRQMQKAINFMEARLRCWIDLEDVADVANFSMFHFHRMFVSVVGVTPKAYIRQRRLSEAARELTFSHRSIREIAKRYQFESQASFTRAFKKQYEITPGRLRKTRHAFAYMAPVDVHKQTKAEGVVSMKPRIVECGAMKVVGMNVFTTQKNNTIPQLWDRFNKECSTIPNIAEKRVALGICPPVDQRDFNEESEFEYIAGVIVSDYSDVPEGMMTYDIPAQKYAVFTHKGALDTLQVTYHAIHAEWLKTDAVELARGPEFEWYDSRFIFGHPDSELDIYIPII
jgi:AraC family transcriptional regulator